MLAKQHLYYASLFLLTASLAVLLLFPREAQLLGRDYFLFLDGAYRTSQGLIPNVDFPSQLGYLNFQGPGLFLHFFPDITKQNPVVSYIVVTGILTLLLSFFLIDSIHWRSFNFFILLVAMASISISLLRVGDINLPTIHGFYRRFCVSMIIVISYFSGIHKPLGSGNRRQIVIALVLALLGYLLLFTKITYFLAALLILLGAYANKRINNRELLISIACFSAMVVITELFMPGILLAYFDDLLVSANISERSSGWLKHLGSVFSSDKLLSLILLVSALASMSFSRPDRVTYLVTLSTTLIGYIFATKFDGGPVNLGGTLGLIPLFLYYAKMNKVMMWAEGTSLFGIKKIAFLAMLLIFLLPIALRASVNAGVSVQYFLAKLPNVRDKVKLADYTFYINLLNVAHVESTSDIDAQMRALQGAEKLLDFDLASAMNYGYKLRPALNSLLWVHPGLNVSKETHPNIGDVIGDAGFVLVPKVPLWGFATDFLTETYGGQLSSEFCVVLDNQRWVLYRKLGLDSDVLPCDLK